MAGTSPAMTRHKMGLGMTDIAKLESELLIAIERATDEAALENVRVSALGKNGSISALLKTLGGMTPDERKAQGPVINDLKERITQAIGVKKEALEIGRASCRERV